MIVLVVGGAGYIGSHMVKMLRLAGHVPVVADDLSSGRREALPGVRLLVGDIGDIGFVDRVLGETRPRSEEHTSELQSLMRSSYAVFCLKKKQKMITLYAI